MACNCKKRKSIKRILKIIELKGKLFYMKYVRVVLMCIVELVAELYFTYKGGGGRR
jgi:hypothetical protein